MNETQETIIRILIEKGVTIPAPSAIEIGPEVDHGRIAGEGVVIHSGCRISGAETLILPGVKLGREAPVTIDDCQLGPEVDLKGGSFRRSTFLRGVSFGTAAEVRDGCLLEEAARGAHTVGIKHTILFPFVTLGSLVNFCDCLMAGGTSRKNHSEVGSSYVHFNYTPNQDKATPSLIGDVPRGVMLREPPIFLGGQGGLIGPSRVGYGTVIAAGVVYRGDCPEGGKLILGNPSRRGTEDFHPGLYREIKNRVFNNVVYIANLSALRQWYLDVRAIFYRGNPLEEVLFRGALAALALAFEERIKRLKELAEKMPHSIEVCRAAMKKKAPARLLTQERELYERFSEIEEFLWKAWECPPSGGAGDDFIARVERGRKESGGCYVTAIQGLEPEWSSRGTRWLQGIVDGVNRGALRFLPSFTRR